MLRIQSILYPTDFSACAAAAFPHAVHIARLHQATVHIAHVAPSLGSHSGGEAAEHGEAVGENDRRDELDADIDALIWAHDADDVAIRRVYAHHVSPSTALLEMAEAEDVDLIVMGSHGRTGVRRLLLGSVAQEMIRRAACPVLVVRQPEGMVQGVAAVARLLVPYDFSAHAEHSLRYAHELASLYRASIDVVHVIDPATHLDRYVVEVNERGRVLADMVEEARGLLEMIDAELDGPDLSVAYHVLVGYPPREIVEFALRNGSGMVVMSSHGRTGKRHVLMGSVAEYVVHHAACPAFIAKPFGKSLVISGANVEWDEVQAGVPTAEELYAQ